MGGRPAEKRFSILPFQLGLFVSLAQPCYEVGRQRRGLCSMSMLQADVFGWTERKTMKPIFFENVAIEAVECALPSTIVTSAEIESQLAGTMERDRNQARAHRRADSGIRERRFWDADQQASDVATLAAEKVLAKCRYSPGGDRLFDQHLGLQGLHRTFRGQPGARQPRDWPTTASTTTWAMPVWDSSTPWVQCGH
jgi:hypothetical protein